MRAGQAFPAGDHATHRDSVRMTSPARFIRIACLLTLLQAALLMAADKPKAKGPATKPVESATDFAPADERKTGRLPDHTTGLAELAAQAFARKDWDKARAHYLEMLKTEPDNPLALANIGAVEQQPQQWTWAVRETDIKHRIGQDHDQ